jgi:hypothetical protein
MGSKFLTKDEARRIRATIAKLPEISEVARCRLLCAHTSEVMRPRFLNSGRDRRCVRKLRAAKAELGAADAPCMADACDLEHNSGSRISAPMSTHKMQIVG